jgi:hypothetical protein
MATEHWFRWHHGTVTDPKWRVVASRCVTNVTVGHVVSVWAAMVENASQATPRGHLQGWDDEDIAALFGYDVAQVTGIREAMQGKTLDGDDLASWEKRQPSREDSSAERTRGWRKRRSEEAKLQATNVTEGNAAKRGVTHSDARGEESREEKKEQEQSSLRSDSSTAAPLTQPGDIGRAQAERLVQVTSDAINAFNAKLGKPVGMLPAINAAVGAEKRRGQVKRCLRVARQICQEQFGAPTITREFWEAYWAECDLDDFKSGRQPPGKGHDSWTPSFEYLTRESVMLDVFDKATSAGAAA